MKKLLNYLKGSPKTSITAAITTVLTTALTLGYIDQQTFMSLMGVAATFGFAASQDQITPKNPA